MESAEADEAAAPDAAQETSTGLDNGLDGGVGMVTPGRAGEGSAPDDVVVRCEPIFGHGQSERLRGCTWSRSCARCFAGKARELDAVNQQISLAVADNATGVRQRILSASVAADQMANHAVFGTSGPNSKYFCLFCVAKLHSTSVAGYPSLRRVPVDWAVHPSMVLRPCWESCGVDCWCFERLAPGLFDATKYIEQDRRGRHAEPAGRLLEGMRTHGTAFKASAATTAIHHQESRDLLLFKGDMELVELIEGMPLHIDLGVSKDLHDMLMRECTKLDEQHEQWYNLIILSSLQWNTWIINVIILSIQLDTLVQSTVITCVDYFHI